jgi:hypothetical protein
MSLLSSREPNAVELTVDHAWFIAETIGAGSFPWVLAITTPYRDAADRSAFLERQRTELTQLGLVSHGSVVNPAVAGWIKAVCFPDRWLDLRYVRHAGPGGAGEMLRGVVAQRSATTVGRRRKTVVALRSAQLVTFTAVEIDDRRAMVPILGAGLAQRPPARFEEFSLPMRVGARADERLRSGAQLAEVLDYLCVPQSARPMVAAVFDGPRSYVEVVAGSRRDGRQATTEVGMSIVDAAAGRVLVSPSRGFDGEWISTFSPGTPGAIAVAVEQLTALLPDGDWFPGRRLTQDFAAQRI